MTVHLSTCCGFYPTTEEDSGHDICGGCMEILDTCECDTCENDRALDADNDMREEN